jgi:hypothetical protein
MPKEANPWSVFSVAMGNFRDFELLCRSMFLSFQNTVKLSRSERRHRLGTLLDAAGLRVQVGLEPFDIATRGKAHQKAREGNLNAVAHHSAGPTPTRPNLSNPRIKFFCQCF